MEWVLGGLVLIIIIYLILRSEKGINSIKPASEEHLDNKYSKNRNQNKNVP